MSVIGYLIAFVIGTWFGVFIVSLCVVAAKADQRMRGEE